MWPLPSTLLSKMESQEESGSKFHSRGSAFLTPGQGLFSYLSEFAKLEGKAYQVDISWKRDASCEERQKNAYTLSMADHVAISRLGDEPLVEIAKHIKKIEENWSPVAKGSKRTKVDVFSGIDRLHERRVANRQRRQWLQRRDAN